MKKINLTNIKNEKSVSEVLFDALKPKAITNEQSKTVYALKLSVERETEKREDGRNWAIRDIPLYLPEVDLHYQREPKNYEVAKITNDFNINKVEVKAASIRKVGNTWHLFLMDGAHTLSALLYMQSKGFPIYAITCKTFINLTLEEEADLFATQNEGRTNLRGYERYKAELCAKKPTAVIINQVTKEFGLTVKTNRNSTINRYNNINAVEELYRIVKRDGENALRFVFAVLQGTGWKDDMVYTQRMLAGISACYKHCEDTKAFNYFLLNLKQYKSCDEFVRVAQDKIEEHEGHPAEKIRDYLLTYMIYKK